MTTEEKPKKQIQLNFFEVACTGTVDAVGQSKHLQNPRAECVRHCQCASELVDQRCACAVRHGQDLGSGRCESLLEACLAVPFLRRLGMF